MSRTICYSAYTIGEDAYFKVPSVCRVYGKRALLIGGETAMREGLPRLEQALRGSPLQIVKAVPYGGDCCERLISAHAQTAETLGVNLIFGMGGGRALDTAKACADRLGLPVFTFPTIAATCAATTALSVVYRDDGSFDRFYFYDRPPIHAFIDSEVIAKAPSRYLRAGMGDTLGKFYECRLSSRGEILPHASAMAREISQMCRDPLLREGAQALLDCENGVVSSSLEEVTLSNIVSTGLVSLLVDENYNGAIAHSVYYALCLLPGFESRFLHGDVVAYGVLVQLAIDQNPDELKRIRAWMRTLGIPASLREMGIPLERAHLAPVLKETLLGPDMEHLPYPVTEDMVFEAMRLIDSLQDE